MRWISRSKGTICDSEQDSKSVPMRLAHSPAANTALQARKPISDCTNVVWSDLACYRRILPNNNGYDHWVLEDFGIKEAVSAILNMEKPAGMELQNRYGQISS
jgi:hypothetical protein